MHAGRMWKRENKKQRCCEWRGGREGEAQGLNKWDCIDIYCVLIYIFIYMKKGERPQHLLNSNHAAILYVAETFHLFTIWVENDWLWSNQTACHRAVWASERIWGNVHTPASPAAGINLRYQIKRTEINPEQLTDMQITPPRDAHDGAAVSKVDANSGMC